ncbi:MAG: sulfite oxidase [Gemmatimonadaceae bacterium]|nr:sulfite oxidase [Gemmatimonadaceae bacterium]
MSETASAAPLVVVRPHPLCAETPMPVLAEPVTPRESVYVRSNFDNPVLDASHRLSVGGAVRAPFAIGLDELAALPQHEVLVTMECAGNWRLGMTPVPTGEPWEYGALSTTRWSGVPLRLLLERAGVEPGAVEVLATGADVGPRDDAEGPVQFQRSLPLDAARAPDTLVATHMDGVPLTMDHGAPVRLIVPGWYGMASVKWLARLDVITTPFTGYFQSKRYVYHTPDGVVPVTQALVKSMIVSPADGGTSARDVVLRGWAWSGAAPITQVEVQVNGGAWQQAELGAPMSRWAWTPFSCPVVLPPGAVALRSRATDASGAVQPEQIVWNALGYGNNAIRTITVHVG